MQRVANSARSIARQCRTVTPPYDSRLYLLPARAELPGEGDEARGDQAADEAYDGQREHQRGAGSPADGGERLGKGRKPRRGLAAAELAAPGLHPEPEL